MKFETARKANPEAHRAIVRKHRKKFPERTKIKWRESHHRNKEKRNADSREYRRRNRDRLNESRNAYYRAHPEKRAGQKLADLLRTRLRIALKDNQRKGSAVRDLGCSIEQLKIYLASKFYGDMSWQNHGVIWEIDHIKPLFAFDLTQREQLVQACHHSNLQPLLIEDHMLKTIKERKDGQY